MKNMNKLNVLLILLVFIITAVVMVYLPETVVTHTTTGNIPDGWGSKYTYFVIPAIYLILWLIYYLTIPFYKKSKEKKEINKKAIARSMSMYNIFIHIVLIVLIGIDFYILAQVLKTASITFDVTSYIVLAIAFVYLYVGFFVLCLTKNELLFLHWKEFKQNDNDNSFIVKKIISLIGFCVISVILVFNAIFEYVSIIIPILLLALLVIKFLYGFISKKNETLPTL